MSEISMRAKIAARYNRYCREKDILPASAYEIQLLIVSAFDALLEPTEAMTRAYLNDIDPRNYGQGFPGPSRRDEFIASIQAAQEGK